MNKLLINSWLPALVCLCFFAGNYRSAIHPYPLIDTAPTTKDMLHPLSPAKNPDVWKVAGLHTPISRQRKTRCALLFFGIPRLFRSTAFPSIRHYLLKPNKDCDVFVHSYNVSTLTVARNGELDAKVVPEDIYLLVNKNDTEKILMEDMSSFYAKRNLSFFHQHHHQDWGETFGTTDNMVKAWHSIESVWGIMEKYQQKRNFAYTRVGLFRSDVFYTHAIYIQNTSEMAVIPASFVWWADNPYEKVLLNDRAMYGNYEYAKVWASQRFSFVPAYVEKNIRETGYPRQGILSESFMYDLLNTFQVPYQTKAMCFFRLRANGVVLHEDCILPGFQRNASNSGYGSLVGFNHQILSKLKCRGLSGQPPWPLCMNQEPTTNSYFYKVWRTVKLLAS